MKKSPQLSVIIPVYNLGEYIDECLASFETQNPDIEVLILDDGSDDEATISKLKELEERGFSVTWHKNAGVAAARNKLVELSNAPYILSVDPDNTISDQYILQGIEILNTQPEVGVVYSDTVHFTETGEVDVNLPDMEPGRILCLNYIDNCAVFRKEIWEKAGGYDRQMPKTGYEDWDLWMSALDQNWKFHHIPEPLFRYRIRKDSMVQSTKEVEHHVSNYDYLREKHKSLFANHEEEIFHQLGVLLAEQNKAQEEHNANFERIREELEKAVDDKEVHIQNVGVEINSLKEEKKNLLKQLNHSMQSVLKLQQRVNQLESTVVFKFARELKIMLNRLRSNKNMGKRKNFFRKIAVAFSKKSFQVMRRFLAKIFKHIYLALEEARVVIVEAGKSSLTYSEDPYMNWLLRQKPSEDDILKQRVKSGELENSPFFSVVIPVYNPPIKFFKEAIDSVMQQSYENWELILSDDCSTDPKVKQTIEKYRKKDPRIRAIYRETNGHISAASNSGLELVEGDFTVLMDQDDLLSLDALYHVAMTIVEDPETDLVYTDEDKVDESGHHDAAHFKPDWSPENLLSRNYLGHLTVFRTSIMRAIGGWRLGFEGSQDYDLVLRFTEKTDKIKHVPKVLYHWRIHGESAASGEDAKPYAYMAAQKALTEALERRGTPGKIDFLDGFRGYSVRLDLLNPDKKVSIIIPTKDKADVLSVCLESVFEKSTYPNFEVVLVDNNSEEKATFELIERWEKEEPQRFKCVRSEQPFNFSHLMNFGRSHASGDFLILLNNDTKVISEDWIEGMVEQSQRDELGVVGAKLLYPNETVQHAGVVIGLGGAAGHVLVGEHREGPGYFNYVNLLNNYSALTAACFMVRTEIYDEMGGFDESFEVEYNDVDFCLRCLDAGYRNVYVPHVELYHFESISRGHPHLTKESMERHKREIKQLRQRWSKYIENDPHYNPNLSLGAHDFRLKS